MKDAGRSLDAYPKEELVDEETLDRTKYEKVKQLTVHALKEEQKCMVNNCGQRHKKAKLVH